MHGLPHELRLALALLLNVSTFAAAYRFARRRGCDGALQAACDAFLVFFVIQYASVALPGVLGVFNVWTMSLVALGCAAALWAAAGPSPETAAAAIPDCEPAPSSAGSQGRHSHVLKNVRTSHDAAAPPDASDIPRRVPGWLALVAGGMFVTAYVGAHAFDQRYNPPLATDALVYHLPTAVQWLQTGHLGLFPTWYWNPAATYSPATSSTFMAWLMAPTGNDVFARFVQVTPLVWIYCLAARLCRVLGCGPAVSALIGVAAAMARPLLGEAIIAKDDLFVTAFFGAAVLALAQPNLRDRLGPWRVGLAFGMVLASKYTVLLACPLFLFLADAPFRARWRVKQWAVALAVGGVLFLPWYARNAALTGNPLYPVDVKLFGVTLFEGLFGTERDQQLRTAGGVWKMLGTTYHSLPPALLAVLGAGLLAALAGAGRRVLREPLLRACLLGTVATFGIFLATSPHHEVRYMFPILLLLFGVAGLAIERWVRPAPARVAVAGAVAVVSIATGFATDVAGLIAGLLLPAILLTAVGVALVAMQAWWLKWDAPKLAVAAACVVVAGAMWAFVDWQAYVNRYYEKPDASGAGGEGVPLAWELQYAREAPLWTFVRERLPDDASIAVANTYFVYPFLDAEYRRRVSHAPVRRGLHDFLEFPRLGDTVPGDLIVPRMTDAMNAEPDRATWLENLRRSGAQYLVIARFEHEDDPPEARFVAKDSGRFELLFVDPAAGAVYRILGTPPEARVD